MLGEAPGTDSLNQWIGALNDDMSVEDVANQIADSEAFQASYPNLLTNEEFATAFLSNLMGDENVSADLMSAAVQIVTGLLNDGMTRGALALAVVGAMLDIDAQGENHPAHGDLGGVAARLANQIAVAEYYTLDARMADSSSAVLDGVTSDDATIATAKRDIDSPPADAVFGEVGDLSIDENMAMGDIGMVTASDANDDAVSYSLKDAPDGFSIDADTGAISYDGDGLDHETTPTVDLTVVATSVGADGTDTSIEEMVSVSVGDFAESAAVFGDVGELTLEEHADGSGDGNAISVGNVAATDAEGDAITYSIKDNPDGWAILAGGKLCYIGSGIDYEDMSSVDLTIVASSYGEDGRMMQEVEQDVTVQIQNLNDAVFDDAPESLALKDGASGAEGAVAIGTVSASDADDDAVSYRLAGPAVDSDNSGILHTGFGIDANGAITYTGGGISRSVSQSVDLTVIATSRGDNGQDTDVEMTVTVAIEAIQRSDAMFGDVGALMLDENADGSGDGNAIGVGSVTATDAEGDAITYSIAGDSEDWAIGADGELSYTGSGIDHETDASVDLTIVATSIGANGEDTAVEQMVTVDIVNLNDNAPAVGEQGGENSLRASTPEADTATGLTFSVTDADGSVGEYSAAVYEGEGDDMAVSTRFKAVADAANPMSFAIVAIGGAEIAAGDVSLTVKASDGMQDSETAMLSFTVGEALPPEPVIGETYNLLKTRDNYKGTDHNDEIVAEADSGGFATLNGFDTIDGGDGYDTMVVYDISTDPDEGDAEFDAQVSNIERLDIFARGGIIADLSDWEGLEHVELARFGRDGNVSVKVDGVAVSASRTFGGDVTITGAGGEVDIAAGKTSEVEVNSGAHTTSVMAKGGMSVNVNSPGAAASSTVTSVSVDGVQRNLGADEARGDNVAMKTVTVRSDNTSAAATAEAPQYVMADGTTAVDDSATGYYKAASQEPSGGGALAANTVIVTMDKTMADGYVAAGADVGSVHVYSKAIASVSISNTDAIILVQNDSDDPENLSITVNKYGKHAKGAFAGKLCLAGDGSPENIMIDVAGDSEFNLAAGAVEELSVSGAGKLTLGVKNAAGDAASGTLESLTLSGSGKFTMDADGLAKLETIDASAATGDVVITMIGDSVESYSGGSAFDCIGVATHASSGISVDLGAGNDIFKSGASSNKSRVDGGDGMDTLQLKSDVGYTYTPEGGRPNSATIYSNFQVLDVGGSVTASYSAGLLDVDSVIVSESTADSDSDTVGLQASVVTLTHMGDGVGISVNGKGAGTTASIIHMLSEREAGTRYSGELNVALTANGGKTDTKTADGTTGEADLTIAVDSEIEILNIDSSADPGGSSPDVPAKNKPSAGHYDNMLTLDGNGTASESTVEAINVNGNAQLEIVSMDAGLGVLELVDAEDNTGGVTVNAVDSTKKVEMLGGSGGDTFTGSSQDDTIHGNGGNDKLYGGVGAGGDKIRGGAGMDTMSGGDATGSDGGNDTFEYTSASDSQVAWTASGVMHGFDTIMGFNGSREFTAGEVSTEGDVISLGRTLFNSLSGGINTSADDIDSTDAQSPGDTDTTVNSLKAFLGDGDGVFETEEANTDGFGSTTTKYSITTVTETYQGTDDNNDGMIDNNDTPDTRTWVLIDVDGDGDFNAVTDMAIALAGDVTVELADFSA